MKQATRAELETEVEALRVENRRLVDELESLRALERERIKRLTEERRKLSTPLREQAEHA